MQLKDNYTLQKVGEEYVLLAQDSLQVDFSKVITLNETAADIWQHIKNQNFDIQTIITYLTNNYNVDIETAQADAQEMIDSLLSIGAIIH
ncbi:MAG: PqqD family protein [Paludibacteraceae bacterium]|nr:PqqD family protein [Paludibacteraceae bacterium]